MTSRDAWLMLQLVIGLGTELYTARVVVRRYQLHLYTTAVKYVVVLYGCTTCSTANLWQCLHLSIPCIVLVLKKKAGLLLLFVYVSTWSSAIYVCCSIDLWLQSALPGHVRAAMRAWGGVERSLLHPLKDQISQPSCCLTTWNRTSTSCLIVSAS